MYQDKRTGLLLPDSARPKASGYSDAGASLIRRALKGFQARSGSPNEDINWNTATLRQRGRMLYMGAPLATSAVNTNRTKVVGVGLSLKSAVNRELLGLSPKSAKEWQKRTEAEFRLWAGRKQYCDAIGMNNFDSLQQLALVSWLMSGDVFAVLKRYPVTRNSPYSLRIHLVEADRVSTPDTMGGLTGWPGITDGRNDQTGNQIFDGVEVDGNGMVVAYHIRNTYPWQLTFAEPTVWARVEAYGKRLGLPNILHIMSSERPDQYRGVTYLAQVIEPLLQLRRYTESELMAALVQSFFSAWVYTENNTSEMPFNEVGDVVGPGGETYAADEQIGENEYQMGPGTVLHLNPNEKVAFGNPNIPTAGFENFVKTISRMIGADLELPFDVLLKEFNASYSASRGALLEAWESMKMRRAWFVDDFCQPVYEIWLAEAVALGRVKAPGFFDDPLLRAAWCGARWIGPVQGQLDPLKEAKAAVLLINRGIKTHEQVTRELGGGDWEANVEQVKRENELLRQAGCLDFVGQQNENALLNEKEGADD